LASTRIEVGVSSGVLGAHGSGATVKGNVINAIPLFVTVAVRSPTTHVALAGLIVAVQLTGPPTNGTISGSGAPPVGIESASGPHTPTVVIDNVTLAFGRAVPSMSIDGFDGAGGTGGTVTAHG
jgi:hypothetical protein